MSLTIGVRDVRKAAAVLDPEYKNLDPEPAAELEDMARSLLEFAFDLYESKAKFTVVGQLRYNPHEPPGEKYIDPEDARASKVALGAYGTEKQAEDAALKLVFSQDGMSFRTWHLPTFHGTPAAYYKGVNDRRKKAADAERSPLLRELERRAAWFADHPEAMTFEPEDGKGAAETIGWGGVTPNVTPEAA